MGENIDRIFNSDQFRETLKAFESILETGKEVYLDVDDCTALCEYYASAGLVDKAGLAALYGLHLHPDDLDLQLYRIDNFIADGYVLEAQELINEIPDKADTQVRLAQCELYLYRGRDAAAADLFEKIVAEDEDRLECMADIADLLMQYDHFPEAHRWINRALQEDPGCEAALTTLVDCLMQEEREQDAIEILERLIDGDPYRVDHWLTLARCYINEGNSEKAVEAADFALAINPDSLTAMKLKGMAYIVGGDMDLSTEWLERALEGITYKRDILEQLIVIYFHTDRHSECASRCRMLLTVCPELKTHEKAKVHARICQSLTRTGDYEDALKEIDSAIKLDDYTYLYRAYRGNTLLYLGREEEGQRSLGFAYGYALDEQKEDAVKLITKIELEHGCYGQAASYLENLLFWQFDIIGSGAWMYLSLCYMMTGDNRSFDWFIGQARLQRLNPDEETRQQMENLHEGLYDAFRTAQRRVVESEKKDASS